MNRTADVPRLLRSLWIANSALVAAVIIVLIVATGAAPLDRTPAAERWFYLNAVVNFAGIGAALFLHLRFGKKLARSSFRTEALRYAYLQRFAMIVPLYAGTLFAAFATFVGGELVNLLFTVTFFAAALHFYPSERRLARDLQHARESD